MIAVRSPAGARRRRGITLTEILIAILIMAVGLASLATLFPLGLLRLREAARSTRSAYLMESAAADVSARGLLTSTSFAIADQYNIYSSLGLTPWFTTNGGQNYNPLIQDTPGYSQDYMQTVAGNSVNVGANSGNSGGYGLPFAYDPLWRYQTQNPSSTFGPQGYYLNDTGALEARFGAGLGYIQNDPSDGGVPSAHGLQRLTNFNRPYVIIGGNTIPVMPVSLAVPNIFVSPEDVVWQEPTNQNYLLGVPGIPATAVGPAPSPVIPDLSLPDASGNPSYAPAQDWHYSWMFTGQQNNGSSASSFDGNLVIFENRPFGIINTAAIAPNPPGGNFAAYQVDGETVVEGVFGYSAKVASDSGGAPGFGVSADRAVLLRWYSTLPDAVVKVGDWIADVTYERQSSVVQSRFLSFQQYTGPGGTAISGAGQYGGLQNPYNNGEWDNLPAQRCFWYRVQKTGTPAVDAVLANARSMVVYVDRSLQARTPLNASGQPYSVNAALICPSVVNVIPQTFFTR